MQMPIYVRLLIWLKIPKKYCCSGERLSTVRRDAASGVSYHIVCCDVF